MIGEPTEAQRFAALFRAVYPGASREDLERQTLDYMATMPAWRDHPRVAGR